MCRSVTLVSVKIVVGSVVYGIVMVLWLLAWWERVYFGRREDDPMEVA